MWVRISKWLAKNLYGNRKCEIRTYCNPKTKNWVISTRFRGELIEAESKCLYVCTSVFAGKLVERIDND